MALYVDRPDIRSFYYTVLAAAFTAFEKQPEGSEIYGFMDGVRQVLRPFLADYAYLQ
jgi:hypothetical protein